MKEVPLCSLIISSEIPNDEIESLSSSIRITTANVQESKRRIAGADDIALLITIAVGIGQLTEYSIKVTKAIIKWRREARQKGIKPQGRLEHPDRLPLDLNTATDEEVEEWLSR